MTQQVYSMWESLKNTTNRLNSSREWKMIATISSIGIAIGSAMVINKIRAREHDNIPMIAKEEFAMIRGHLPLMIRQRRKFNEYLYQTLKKEGFPSIVSLSRPPNTQLLIITNPVHVRYIFETNFESAKKGKEMQDRFEELLGDGIFTSNGDRWRFHRKIASRMFSMRNLKNFFYDTSVKNVLSTINKLHNYDNEIIDINDLLGRFTVDTFCEIAFGQSMKNVESFPETNEFGQAFDDMVERVSRRAGDMLWKVKRSLNIGDEYYIHKDHMIIKQVVENIINRKDSISSKMSDETGSQSYDILSLYLKHDPTLTHKQLYDIAVNFIIAGRDTTRMLISWWIWELCRKENKDIVDKLYKEIDNFHRQPTYSDFIKGFQYLEQTLCEALRLHPSVPFLARKAMMDVALLKIDDEDRAYTIRKNDVVLIHNYSMARNPKVWGKDAHVFKPERWTNGVNSFDQYKFAAFNINPRLCLGKAFAIQESKIFTYYFLKNFMFEMRKGHKVIIKGGAILNMQNGLPIVLKPRKLDI